MLVINGNSKETLKQMLYTYYLVFFYDFKNKILLD